MNCLKYLRTHARILIFLGVMGGQMTPFLSEAGTPTVTIQVDASQQFNVPVSACAIPSGYTACWTLSTANNSGNGYPGTGGRAYLIKGYGGSLPRLLVADSTGSSLDIITLTTVEFAPRQLDWTCTSTSCPNKTEKHTLTVRIAHKFDNKPNPIGTYLYALRTSGMFKSNVSTLSASSDFVKFVGTGVFSSAGAKNLLSPMPSGATCDPYNSRSTDVNYCPLKRTMATTTVTISSFSSNPTLQQVSPYPSFSCDNGAGSCTPTVNLTMTGVVIGPDSFILSSSNDAVGGSCNLDPTGPPTSLQAVPCHNTKKGKKSLDQMIQDYFDQQTLKDAAAFAAETPPAQMTPACTGDPLDPDEAGDCGCLDPDVCATVQIIKTTNVDGTFKFNVTDHTNSEIPVIKEVAISTSNGTGTLFIGLTEGVPYTVEEIPQEGDGWTFTDQNSCGTESFNVTLGQTTTCGFQNTYTPPGDGGPILF
jgi:hypothetical protein